MKFQMLTELKNKLDQYRPISSDLMKTLAQKFREEWTYHTIPFILTLTMPPIYKG